MVIANRKQFKKIYSIELSKHYYEIAKERTKKFSNIIIYQGDSSKVLKIILSKIKTTCLFWLDAHYCGGESAKGRKEAPIIEELNQIFAHGIKNHIILIDDARLFIGENDYPTLKNLKVYIKEKQPNWVLL
ncbi:MAG: hypothetical protein ACTSRZ_12255 [Promethearchaeota archaeon]